MSLKRALVVTFVLSSVAAAAGVITRDEALAEVYPGAAVRAEQLFLTAAQQQAVRTRSGGEITTALVARYVASRDGHVVGYAYVDTHTVRTKKESLLISLDADGSVLRIDVTAFHEPREYQ